jgi:hypothetical protein
MTCYTHEYDPKIPVGFACLAIDNNGWVGTSNGWPHDGQPALFPKAQAEAIAIAWNIAKDNVPNKMYWPTMVSEEARKWLRWSDEDVAKREEQSTLSAGADVWKTRGE